MLALTIYIVCQIVQVGASVMTICDACWRFYVHARARAPRHAARLLETQLRHAS